MNIRAFHLQSFLFAAIVLVSVLMHSSLSEVKAPHLTTSTVSNVSANAATALIPASSELIPVKDNASESFIAEENEAPVVMPDTYKAAAIYAQFLHSDQLAVHLNDEAHWPLASITKLMTGVIALESTNSEVAIQISEAATAQEGGAGGFKVGDRYTAADLIRAMLTVSSNDASFALSEQVGSERFVDAMQQKAAMLGMHDTTFRDSTGLSFLNQSTPRDVMKLMRYIYDQHPELLEITTHRSNAITELNTNTKRTLVNINQLAGHSAFLGGKTGYTDEAKGNLVSLFMVQEKPMVIIIFGTHDRFGETLRVYNELK